LGSRRQQNVALALAEAHVAKLVAARRRGHAALAARRQRADEGVNVGGGVRGVRTGNGLEMGEEGRESGARRTGIRADEA
jgi:hypothetical protein